MNMMISTMSVFSHVPTAGMCGWRAPVRTMTWLGGASFRGGVAETPGFDPGNLAHEHIAQSGLLLHKAGKCGIAQLDEVGLFQKKHVGARRKHVKELDLADEGLSEKGD